MVVDGNDVLAVMAAVGRGRRARARAATGPTLLEFKTFRMRGHEEASGTAYVPKQLFEEWAAKDPVARFEARLLARRACSTTAERDQRTRRVQGARSTRWSTRRSRRPSPSRPPERELADVYAPARRRVAGAERRTAPGARAALRRRHPATACARRCGDDREVLLLGQDIAEYGGVFKVTEGFVEEFGKARVRNTPIIESGALGAALGLALDGFLPMVEMQFGDFITCGFNQIVNNLAKTHYRWGAGVPVVVRAPVGGGTGAGPFHSQNVEAWFTHVAGLKVVAPGHALRREGPAAGGLRGRQPGALPRAQAPLPLGQGPRPRRLLHGAAWPGPSRARRARDATIVTYGVGVAWALEAADDAGRARARRSRSIDLRTLLPWDRERVLASVRKTSRALVLHEAPADRRLRRRDRGDDRGGGLRRGSTRR